MQHDVHSFPSGTWEYINNFISILVNSLEHFNLIYLLCMAVEKKMWFSHLNTEELSVFRFPDHPQTSQRLIKNSLSGAAESNRDTQG